MIPHIPEETLYQIVKKRGASDNEFDTLWMALEGKSNAEIAQTIGVSDIAIRKRLGELYRKFEIDGRGPGKLGQLKQILLDEYQQEGQDSTKLFDWGPAPSISHFYGRSAELAQLQRSILDKDCRLISVLGMGGMGKTTLVRYQAEQMQDRFQFIIWRSLAAAPLLEDILNEILFQLAPTDEFPPTEKGKIDALISLLKQKSGLLVLDDAEAILQEQASYGQYQNRYRNYGTFLQQLGQINHQSKVLLISPEPLRDLSRLERSTNTVRSLKVDRLELEAAIQLLKQQGCQGKQQDWQYLQEVYNGNPLYLKLVAGTVKDFFKGNVADFTQLETVVIPEIELIQKLYERLSPLEQEILKHLATAREAQTLLQIKESLDRLSFSETLEVLESLNNRSLLEKGEKNKTDSFKLQPVIEKYIKRYVLDSDFQLK